MLQAIGRFLLFLEVCWAIYWIVTLFIFQFANDSLLFRNAFAITAFHAVNPAIIYAALRRLQTGRKPQWIAFLIFLFAFATDLNSLLETVLHLKDQANYLYHIMLGITLLALILSTLAIGWFTAVYFTQRNRKDRANIRFPVGL